MKYYLGISALFSVLGYYLLYETGDGWNEFAKQAQIEIATNYREEARIPASQIALVNSRPKKHNTPNYSDEIKKIEKYSKNNANETKIEKSLEDARKEMDSLKDLYERELASEDNAPPPPNPQQLEEI